MNRRQFEQSEVWQIVKTHLDNRLVGLVNTWADSEDDAECHRVQGAVRELRALRDDFPVTFPNEIVKGKPSVDPVAEVLDGKH